MITFGEVKLLVLRLKGLAKEDVLSELKRDFRLDTRSDIKNMIWQYLFPRPIGHMQLPIYIKDLREKTNSPLGYLEKNLTEISMLLEAYRGEQYNRFIKHLIYSYALDDLDISPYECGIDVCECAVCKKKLYGSSEWAKRFHTTNVERSRCEQLAFRGDDTSLTVCLNCLIQLRYLREIIELLEPNAFKYAKRRF